MNTSIAGSILGNALLVLGLSLLAGGLKNGRQTFDSHVAGISATMLLLAVLALSMEGLFSTGPHAVQGDADKDALSVGIAVLLLIMGAMVGGVVFLAIYLQKKK